MSALPDPPSRAEQRRLRTHERRQQTIAEVLGDNPAAALPQSTLSFAGRTLSQAFPRPLIDEGLITFDTAGSPRLAGYDPALLAPNPQRGRVIDQGLEELAASLDTHGQQRPIIARLITATDRQRWPDAFSPGQLLVIVEGHRLFYAQKQSKLRTLRVELMLPEEGEDELAYSRRGLRRAAIKMMHSQAYGILDKVEMYKAWCDEFSLSKPKDREIAAFFETSRSEAQRVKAVSKLEKGVARQILTSDQRPADEVLYFIANRPAEEQPQALRRYGHLTVAAARRLFQMEKGDDVEKPKSVAGRPQNFVLRIAGESSPLVTITTRLTARQWREQGGSEAFLQALQALATEESVRETLRSDLG